MSGWQIALLVILIVMIAAIVVLYILGKRAQKKKEEQDEQLAAAAQTVTMLVIDKKRLRLNESGLPQQVIDQTPKLMRRSKLPIVKAKVGPKIMSLIADEAVFDDIPVKKEVKATVSGLYITAVRGLRGPLEKPEKKKGFRAKMRDKYNSLSAELKKGEEETKTTKKSKKSNSKK
jgi:type II secretory pathway pseudopilin PulG